MSKLDELIAELCPEGVEFHRINEYCDLEKGKTPIQKAIPGEYPLVVTTAERKTANTYQFDSPTVCIPLVSSRGHGVASLNEIFYQEGRFALGNILCGVTPRDSLILSAKFLYVFLNYSKDYLLVPQMKGGANVSLSIDAISRVKIPIPPIEVQNEIVRILDTFTCLSAELSAELSARRKQYDYYRDLLLSYGNEFHEITIQEMLCMPITDGPHETPALHAEGVPFLSAEAIVNNKLDFGHIRGYISREYDTTCAKKYKPRKWDVFMCKSGSTTGKVAINDTDIDFNIWSPLAALRVNDKYSAKYLFYLLQTRGVQEQVRAHASHGSQPNLSMRKLEQFKVKVPPLEIQERIVRVLDNFESICSDLNIGLPAEIEKRQKQYEYYRDLLLTFAETGGTLDRIGSDRIGSDRIGSDK